MTIAPLKIDLLSNAERLPAVRDALRAWLQQQEWSESQVSEITLAVDEALTNVIRHGYDNRPGQKIEFVAKRTSDAKAGPGIEIQIRDYGKQVPLTKICGRDLNEIRPGGLGVHLIKAMMSFAEYSHASGGGLRLLMRKLTSHNAECKE